MSFTQSALLLSILLIFSSPVFAVYTEEIVDAINVLRAEVTSFNPDAGAVLTEMIPGETAGDNALIAALQASIDGCEVGNKIATAAPNSYQQMGFLYTTAIAPTAAEQKQAVADWFSTSSDYDFYNNNCAGQTLSATDKCVTYAQLAYEDRTAPDITVYCQLSGTKVCPAVNPTSFIGVCYFDKPVTSNTDPRPYVPVDLDMQTKIGVVRNDGNSFAGQPTPYIVSNGGVYPVLQQDAGAVTAAATYVMSCPTDHKQQDQYSLIVFSEGAQNDGDDALAGRALTAYWADKGQYVYKTNVCNGGDFKCLGFTQLSFYTTQSNLVGCAIRHKCGGTTNNFIVCALATKVDMNKQPYSQFDPHTTEIHSLTLAKLVDKANYDVVPKVLHTSATFEITQDNINTATASVALCPLEAANDPANAYGELVFREAGATISSAAVNSWWDTQNFYSYGENYCFSGGHTSFDACFPFLQMTATVSVSMGCGYDDTCPIATVVCHFQKQVDTSKVPYVSAEPVVVPEWSKLINAARTGLYIPSVPGYSVLPLRKDDALVAKAKKEADRCLKTYNNSKEAIFSFMKTTNITKGGNISETNESEISRQAVPYWLSEYNDYNFLDNTCYNDKNNYCSSYTQIVYRPAKTFGCDIGYCKVNGKNTSNLVCMYDTKVFSGFSPYEALLDDLVYITVWNNFRTFGLNVSADPGLNNTMFAEDLQQKSATDLAKIITTACPTTPTITWPTDLGHLYGVYDFAQDTDRWMPFVALSAVLFDHWDTQALYDIKKNTCDGKSNLTECYPFMQMASVNTSYIGCSVSVCPTAGTKKSAVLCYMNGTASTTLRPYKAGAGVLSVNIQLLALVGIAMAMVL